MASFEMLYAILDDFRADSDDFEALASYYEHHYRRRYGKIVDLEHFLIMYMVDPRVTDKRNIPDYLAMIHFMEQLEELEREYRVLCTERLLTPYTPEERLLRWEYLEILRLQNTVRSLLLPIILNIWEKEKELLKAARTREQQRPPAAEDLIATQKKPPAAEEIEPPAAEEEITPQIEPPTAEEVITSKIEPPATEEVITSQIEPPTAEEEITPQIEPPTAEEVITSKIEPPATEEVITSQIEPPTAEEVITSKIEPPATEEVITSQIEPPTAEEVISTEEPLGTEKIINIREPQFAEEEINEQEEPPAVERLTRGRRVRRAIARRLQRISHSARRILRGICCHQPPPAP
ncbi:glutenin, low molecular weight subunit [Xenopus tropicalis]|uniref:Glutenin, low molecular weight subunit n=1 Tax=Xenopus tropicalis TaxID=8364 RepID=A0A8J1JV60_XENTR|nr:glutenin, low molecular weight subunit [Xenopus tropicalis]